MQVKKKSLFVYLTFYRLVAKNTDKLLLLSLFATGLFYFFRLISFWFQLPYYSFFHDDEMTYVLSARMFAQCGSLKAPWCFMEAVSPILKTHWYGPCYHLLYGGIQYVIQNENLSFVGFHLLLSIIILFSVFLFPLSQKKRLTIAILILFSYPFLVYPFTFFPETFHIFASIPLTFLLFKMFNKPENQAVDRKWLLVYVFLVLIFSAFRITTVFWLAALPFLAINRKTRVMYWLTAIAGLIVVVVYMKLFLAPPFVRSMGMIDHFLKLELVKFWDLLIVTLRFNLSSFFLNSMNDPAVLLNVAMMVFLGVYAVITRNRISGAAAMIGFLYYLSLVGMYNADKFYLIKQTACLLPLFVVIIVKNNKWVAVAFMAFQLLMAPLFLQSAEREIQNRAVAGNQRFAYKKHQAFELQQLSSRLACGKPVVVEIIHYEHAIPRQVFYASLPVTTSDKQPITWTASLRSKTLFPNDAYEDRFPHFWRLKVDYVLSRDTIANNKLIPVHRGSFFYLFKDNRE